MPVALFMLWGKEAVCAQCGVYLWEGGGETRAYKSRYVYGGVCVCV